MGLKWAPLLIPILALAGFAAWHALRRPRHGWQGELPYFARAHRLTDLPEYRRALKVHERLSVAALALVAVVVLMLAITTVRPVRTLANDDPDSSTPYVDIMMCFGASNDFTGGDDSGVGPLLDILRERTEKFGNQRIGVTNGYFRVLPMTDDHRAAADRLGALSQMADKFNTEDTTVRFSIDDDGWDRRKYGSRRTAGRDDTLASCAMGFPRVGSDNGRGRMIVYVGNPEWGEGEATPIYTDDMVRKAIETAGIQVNAIVPGDITGPMGFMEKLVRDTGGRQIAYTPIQILDDAPTDQIKQNLRDELTHAVDTIFANPASGALDATLTRGAFQWDVPEWFLRIALLAAVGAAVCRAGMRL